jgi:hypothetical protein
MEQSLSWEANRSSASQEIPRILSKTNHTILPLIWDNHAHKLSRLQNFKASAKSLTQNG